MEGTGPPRVSLGPNHDNCRKYSRAAEDCDYDGGTIGQSGVLLVGGMVGHGQAPTPGKSRTAGSRKHPSLVEPSVLWQRASPNPERLTSNRWAVAAKSHSH